METLRRSKRSCVTRSMSLYNNNIDKKLLVEDIHKIKSTRLKRKRNSSLNTRRKKTCKKKKNDIKNIVKETLNITENKIELCDLSEEVLILILENVSSPGLINMSKTSWLFHRLCKTDTLWKHRCKVSPFNLFYFQI